MVVKRERWGEQIYIFTVCIYSTVYIVIRVSQYVFRIWQAHIRPWTSTFSQILAKVASGNCIMCEIFSTALWHNIGNVFWECVKNAQRHKKNLKKQRPDMKTTLSFLQSCKVAGNYFINLIFFTKMALFMFRRSKNNYQLAKRTF